MSRAVADAVVACAAASAAHWAVYHLVVGLREGEPLEPSRYMASVLLGRAAFDPAATGTAEALLVGWVGHVIVSFPWSLAFAALGHARPRWFATPARTAAVGVLGGIVVWIGSVYVLGPLLGMPWFTEQHVPTKAGVHLVFGLVNAFVVRARTDRRTP